MISLRKKEQLEVFQLTLTKKVKLKQSPFIAVLLLVKEFGSINALNLKESLLSPLPERACETLLNRLDRQVS